MNKLTLVLILSLANCIISKPLNSTFKCPEVQNEVFFFKSHILDNSSNFESLFSNIYNYFNLSEIYIIPSVDKVEMICKNNNKLPSISLI